MNDLTPFLPTSSNNSPLSKFISTVKTNGLARTNRYEVIIHAPGSSSEQSALVQILCESASLPGINVQTIPSRIQGEQREMPYEWGFDPVTMTFYVDSNMNVKALFDKWMSLIFDPVTRSVGYYNNYVKDIDIIVYTIAEDVAPYMIKLYEAYPKTVSTVQLDQGARDVMKLQVTFAYKYWEASAVPVDTAGTSGPVELGGGFESDPQSIQTASSTQPDGVVEEQFGESQIVSESFDVYNDMSSYG